MLVFRGRAEAQAQAVPTAVGIGIFDGVHRGHQALLQTVLATARGAGLRSMAYTFDPHPAAVLKPEVAPELIEPCAWRLERLAALGLDAALVEPFDRDFAGTDPEAFVRMLAGPLQIRDVVVGAGFTFGRRGRGDVALLTRVGEPLGLHTHPVTHVEVDGVRAASTQIRACVRAGDVRGAARLLGRPYALRGVVVEGAHRGTGMGFPTANLRSNQALRPGLGVYACRAHGPFGSRPAVTNIGVNPTFDGAVIKVEAHLLDYTGPSFYGANVTLELIDKVRDERRFETVAALKAQIVTDVARTQAILDEDMSHMSLINTSSPH